jgi:hypothetical protein
MTREAHRNLVQRESETLAAYGRRFDEWLSGGFTSYASYIVGDAPASGAVAEIPATMPPNAPRAWTWEGRLSADDFDNHPVPIRNIFITADDAAEFSTWLRERTALTQDEFEESDRLFRSLAILTSDPFKSLVDSLLDRYPRDTELLP